MHECICTWLVNETCTDHALAYNVHCESGVLLDTGTCVYPSDVQVDLVDYGMNSVSQGIDALAITRVVIRPVGQMKPGVTPQVMFWYCVRWLCPQQAICLSEFVYYYAYLWMQKLVELS